MSRSKSKSKLRWIIGSYIAKLLLLFGLIWVSEVLVADTSQTYRTVREDEEAGPWTADSLVRNQSEVSQQAAPQQSGPNCDTALTECSGERQTTELGFSHDAAGIITEKVFVSLDFYNRAQLNNQVARIAQSYALAKFLNATAVYAGDLVLELLDIRALNEGVRVISDKQFYERLSDADVHGCKLLDVDWNSGVHTIPTRRLSCKSPMIEDIAILTEQRPRDCLTTDYVSWLRRKDAPENCCNDAPVKVQRLGNVSLYRLHKDFTYCFSQTEHYLSFWKQYRPSSFIRAKVESFTKTLPGALVAFHIRDLSDGKVKLSSRAQQLAEDYMKHFQAWKQVHTPAALTGYLAYHPHDGAKLAAQHLRAYLEEDGIRVVESPNNGVNFGDATDPLLRHLSGAIFDYWILVEADLFVGNEMSTFSINAKLQREVLYPDRTSIIKTEGLNDLAFFKKDYADKMLSDNCCRQRTATDSYIQQFKENRADFLSLQHPSVISSKQIS